MSTPEELHSLEKELEDSGRTLPDVTKEELEKLAGGMSEEWYWHCFQCNTGGGPVSADEAQTSIFNHMAQTNHMRIMISPTPIILDTM